MLLREMIKLNVREISQQYSWYRASSTRNKINELTKQLNEMESKIVNQLDDKEMVENINRIKQQLEISHLTKAKGAQIRAGIKWAGEGEKCT